MTAETEETTQDTSQEDTIQLEWRNPVYNRWGTIDMEVKHPTTGEWVKFTATPDDIFQHGRDLHAAALATDSVAPYVPPTAEQARAMMPDLTRKQFRLGMRDLGVTSAMIDAALAAIPDEDARQTAQIEWEDSPSYSRVHPLIAQLAAAFGKTDEQIDLAWMQALTYS